VSLVSDIPAGDGKIANLFLQCCLLISCFKANTFAILLHISWHQQYLPS
jgi:hypothetical protein